MIIIQRRDTLSKKIKDSITFSFYHEAISYLKLLPNGTNYLFEIKRVSNIFKHTNEKVCFNTPDKAIKYLKEKNGEQITIIGRKPYG